MFAFCDKKDKTSQVRGRVPIWYHQYLQPNFFLFAQQALKKKQKQIATVAIVNHLKEE